MQILLAVDLASASIDRVATPARRGEELSFWFTAGPQTNRLERVISRAGLLSIF